MMTRQEFRAIHGEEIETAISKFSETLDKLGLFSGSGGWTMHYEDVHRILKGSNYDSTGISS